MDEIRTHTYVCAKGYAEEYKGRNVKWQSGKTLAAALARGEFPDEATLVYAAQKQLDVKRGHAIQAATVEVTKDAEGKDTTTLANPNLSLAAMEKIAAETVFTAPTRTRIAGGGGQKVAAQKFTSAQEKIATKLPTATAENIAEWIEYGLITEDMAAGRLAELGGKGGKARR